MNRSRRRVRRWLNVWLLTAAVVAGGWNYGTLPVQADGPQQPLLSLISGQPAAAAILSDVAFLSRSMQQAIELADGLAEPGNLFVFPGPVLRRVPLLPASHSCGALFWQHVRLQI